MTRKSLLSLVSITAVLVLAAPGCGGSSSSNKDGAAGSGGSTGSGGSANGDGPSRGEVSGTGGGGDDDGGAGGTGGGAGGGGGMSGSGGGAGGSGGAGTDAAADRGGTGGAADAGRDVSVTPMECQAGETCTGTYMCNATRCLRGEREVCHCVNGSLFCGPADCVNPDAGTPDARPDATVTPMCAAGIQSGDDCNGGTDRQCNSACVAGRQRLCFCNATNDEWICTALTRCQN